MIVQAPCVEVARLLARLDSLMAVDLGSAQRQDVGPLAKRLGGGTGKNRGQHLPGQEEYATISVVIRLDRERL